MKKLFLVMVMVGSLVSGVFAAECDNDPYYDRNNGHTSVSLNDVFSKNISENVEVCVSSDVQSLWKLAMKGAIDGLNLELSNIDTSLRFSYSENNCVISTENSYNLDENLFATTNYSRLVPGEVIIMINANIETMPSLKKMKYVLAHELLHGIGLMHTGRKYTNPNIIEIPGTDGYFVTKYADRSIMCAISTPDDYPEIKFNILDKVSIETLYSK